MFVRNEKVDRYLKGRPHTFAFLIPNVINKGKYVGITIAGETLTGIVRKNYRIEAGTDYADVLQKFLKYTGYDSVSEWLTDYNETYYGVSTDRLLFDTVLHEVRMVYVNYPVRTEIEYEVHYYTDYKTDRLYELASYDDSRFTIHVNLPCEMYKFIYDYAMANGLTLSGAVKQLLNKHFGTEFVVEKRNTWTTYECKYTKRFVVSVTGAEWKKIRQLLYDYELSYASLIKLLIQREQVQKKLEKNAKAI